jgi:hypothetical protein
MKIHYKDLNAAQNAIDDKIISIDDSYKANHQLLHMAMKTDVFQKIQIPDKPLEHIQLSDIKLPSLWAVIRDWKFWKGVIIEVLQIVIFLIVKSQKK